MHPVDSANEHDQGKYDREPAEKEQTRTLPGQEEQVVLGPDLRKVGLDRIDGVP